MPTILSVVSWKNIREMFHHTHNVTVVSKLHQRQIEKEKGVNHFISVSLDTVLITPKNRAVPLS